MWGIRLKLDISSTPEQIQKSIKSTGRWFVFCVACAVLCIPGNPPLCAVLAVVSFLLWRKKRATKQLLADQTAAADEKAKAAADEKAERIRQQAREAAARQQAFLESHECFREIHTKVVGVTFKNSDGSSRQEQLAYHCFYGDQLELRPFTYRGAPAYAVYDDGVQIGNISSELAQTIHDLAPDAIQGEIAEVTGGDGRNYGCNIVVQLYRNK